MESEAFHRLKGEAALEAEHMTLEGIVERLVGELENDETFTPQGARALAYAYDLQERLEGDRR